MARFVGRDKSVLLTVVSIKSIMKTIEIFSISGALFGSVLI